MRCLRRGTRGQSTPPEAPRESSPFVDFDRASWARLGANTPLPLTAEELDQVRSLGDEVDLDEVREVYLPLSRLLTLHVQEGGRLYRAYRTFLGATDRAHPVRDRDRGSVSVGKSTTARLLRLLLARWPQHPRVELVTTDGFLLAERGAGAARADGAQGLPGVLRPAGAAAGSSARSRPGAPR